MSPVELARNKCASNSLAVQGREKRVRERERERDSLGRVRAGRRVQRAEKRLVASRAEEGSPSITRMLCLPSGHLVSRLPFAPPCSHFRRSSCSSSALLIVRSVRLRRVASCQSPVATLDSAARIRCGFAWRPIVFGSRAPPFLAFSSALSSSRRLVLHKVHASPRRERAGGRAAK